MLKERFPDADAFRVTLYGSLASTGKGHGTDVVLYKILAPADTEIIFDTQKFISRHPNTLDISAFRDGKALDTVRYYSVGGGAVEVEGQPSFSPDVYNLSTFTDIRECCVKSGKRLYEYVFECEGEGIREYLSEIWDAMKAAIHSGLRGAGLLPGPLGIERKAASLLKQSNLVELNETKESRILCAYAYAVCEENACGGRVVTAPTCGACGVLPAVLYRMQERHGIEDEDVIEALATGGLIGNLIKTNASISGAECGCQAEIGSACSMAAAALCELFGLSLDKIEYAAEIAMEHHLGLTCDPILGLVQIPCIERNAVAAMRAINAVSMSEFFSGARKIPFDLIVETMYETGKDLASQYRETSIGGLAKFYIAKNN
jgi:L-serine dehydratase